MFEIISFFFWFEWGTSVECQDPKIFLIFFFLGQLLQLQARIIPDNNFLTGRLMFQEPLTTICDYVPNQIISRANLNMNDMRRVWFILREPFPHCNVSKPFCLKFHRERQTSPLVVDVLVIPPLPPSCTKDHTVNPVWICWRTQLHSNLQHFSLTSLTISLITDIII